MATQASHIRQRIHAAIVIVGVACGAVAPVWAGPFEAPAPQGGGVSGSIGNPGDLYLEYSVSGANLEPIEGESHTYQGTWDGRPIHLSGRAVVDRSGGTVSYCDMGAHVGDQSVAWPPEGDDGRVSGRIQELPFDLTFTPPPDYDISFFTGGAYVRACGGVCGTYRMRFEVLMPTPEPTQEVVETPTPLISPTPERLITIRGKVSVVDVTSELSFVPSSKPLVLPVVDTPVVLMRNGKVLGRTFSDHPDGEYAFQVPITDSLTISATLEHAVVNPPSFHVVYDQADRPIWVATRPFDLSENTPDTLDKPINMSDPAALDTGPTPVPPDRIDDVGLVYYYAREAWEMAAISLGQPLDFPTLTIRAFSTSSDAQGSAFWLGPQTGSSPFDPYIEISPTYTDFSSAAAPDTIMHEFGHHVMADAYDNLMPHSPGDTSHDGFANPSTTDSWTEGFASFYALWTKKDQIGDQSPHLWHHLGTATNLEINHLAWSAGEEFAVTALLWDLLDPVSAEDATQMPVTNWASQPVITSTGTSTSYGDHVQLSTAELWSLLADASRSGSWDRAPDAPQGYDYIFDVRQLYDTLVLNGVGLVLPATPNGLDAVDELFIAHGFFEDTNPQNLAWDPGEAIGTTSNKSLTVDGQTFPSRAVRRSPPPVDDSYISYQIQDADGGTVNDVGFLVSVTFDAPYEAYDYSYHTRVAEEGRLPYAALPRYYQATTAVTPADPRVVSASPLEFTNQSYWAMRAERPSGAVMEHTFEVEISDEPAVPDDGGLGVTGTENPSGLFGGILPFSSASLLLPALCCGGAGAVTLAAALLVLRRQSRKKPGTKPPRFGPPASAESTPIATATVVAGPSCPGCGASIRPGTLFCGSCGQSLVPAPTEEQRSWELVAAGGDGNGRRYTLDGVVTLGRSAENDIQVKDERASRHHALLRPLDGGYGVQDLESTNGTIVNGVPITDTMHLEAGDEVRIGGTVFRVVAPVATAVPTEPRICPRCGKLLEDDARFCGGCGTRL